MKKTYICPTIDITKVKVENHLLAGSAQGTNVFDDPASGSLYILSREDNGFDFDDNDFDFNFDDNEFDF